MSTFGTSIQQCPVALAKTLKQAKEILNNQVGKKNTKTILLYRSHDPIYEKILRQPRKHYWN